jgi:hypothetical protein
MQVSSHITHCTTKAISSSLWSTNVTTFLLLKLLEKIRTNLSPEKTYEVMNPPDKQTVHPAHNPPTKKTNRPPDKGTIRQENH